MTFIEGSDYPYGYDEGPYGLRNPYEAEEDYLATRRKVSQCGAGLPATSIFQVRKASAEQNAAASEYPAPLKMVHVGPCFARGGAEQHIIDLTRFLDPTRVQLTKCVVTQKHMVDPQVVAEMPVDFEFGGREAVQRAATDHDVVMYWGFAADEWLSQNRPQLCIYLAHGESHWTRDLLHNSASVVDHVVAVSERVRRAVCNGHPSTVILNGVDASRLAQTQPRGQVRQQLGFSATDFVLGFVGRFSREKRPELLIETISKLPPHFKALFVGWGAMKAELLELANERIPGRFAFSRSHIGLGDYYNAMDVFTLLSSHEGFGLVLLEAMMCGRPVLATRVGGATEIIRDRISGLLVDGCSDAVVQAARLFHEHPHWTAGVAAEGRAFATEHGHAWRMAREYEDLIEGLWQQKFGSASDPSGNRCPTVTS